MVCECGGGWFTTAAAMPVEYELGPAYADYAADKVSIKSQWEQKRKLVPDWMDECCIEKEPDWTAGEQWQEHTIMLVFYYVFSVSLLGAFVYLRNEQPFRFRDAKAASLLWVVHSYNLTIAVINGNMGGTAATIPGMISSYCGGVLVLYYYIMKCIQVHFVHAWNEAKLHKQSFELLGKFQKVRFIVDFRFYLAGFVVVFVMCLAPMVYALAARDPYTGVLKYNQYDSLRCEWWHIPNYYTIPTSNSPLCNCLEQLPGTDEELCASAVFTACAPSEEKDPAEAGFCDACLPEIATRTITSECRQWFENFYAAGSCGMPSLVPRTSTCTIGAFADRTMGYIAASMCFFFMLLNVIAIIPLLRKRDEFGIIHENVICCTIVIPSLLFCYTPLLPGNGGLLDWYLDDLKITYRPLFFFMWINVWGSIATTFGYPLCLYCYKEYVLGPEDSEQESTAEDMSPRSDTQASNYSQTHTIPRHAEKDLEHCVRNEALIEIYKRFAVEAFHVGQVRFLEDCSEFLGRVNTHGAADHLPNVIEDTQELLNTYIKSNAPMEMNISSKLRRSVCTDVETFLEQSASSSEFNDDVDEALAVMLQSFASVYDEIRRLVAMDCWPRFKQSRHYPHYQAVVFREHQVSSAIGRMTGRHFSSLFTADTEMLPAIEMTRSRNKSSDHGS